MFAFYFGVVSTITPPVALASFAGAAIARTPPMATAVESTRIGIAKYLVPFVFIYNPALLFEAPGWRIALAAVLTLAGLWALSVALEGWLHGRVGSLLRAVLLVAAGAILVPIDATVLGVSGLVWTTAGLLVAGALLLVRRAGAAVADVGEAVR